MHLFTKIILHNKIVIHHKGEASTTTNLNYQLLRKNIIFLCYAYNFQNYINNP